MLEFLYRTQDNISYSFILISYAICSAICILLIGLEYGARLEAVQGYWVVFSPFLPCLLWAAAMKSQADRERSTHETKAKQE